MLRRLNNNLPTLLNAIELEIVRNQPKLSQFYNTSLNSELFERLSQCESSVYHYNQRVLSQRKLKFSKQANKNFNKTAEYNEFIRELYPLLKESNIQLTAPVSLVNWFTNLVKYSQINHNKLFDAYAQLGNPFGQLTFNEYQDFLNKYLFNYVKFKKPNVLSDSTVEGREKFMVMKDFQDMQEKRGGYVKQVSSILNYLSGNGFDLTVEEQNSMLYSVFFKDSPGILNKLSEIEGFVPEYVDFNESMFEEVTRSMNGKLGKIPVETKNILLFHAIRHGVESVRSSLTQPDTDWIDITNVPEQNNHTMRLLLYNHQPSDIPNFDSVIPDIKLINKVLMSLVSHGEISQAQNLFVHLFINNEVEEIDEIESRIYKLLTPQDERVYKKLFLMLENIQRITGTATLFRVLPIEKTFQIMIKASNDNQALGLLDIMTDKFKLPISTGTFSIMYDKLQNGTDLDALILLTNKLVSLHDHLVNFTSDSSMKVGEFSKQVEAFKNERLVEYDLDLPAGSFVKLTDDLIEKVYVSFLSVLRRNGNKELENKIGEQKKELQERVQALKSGYGDGGEIYLLDEVNYLNKSYLVDLVWELFSKNER